MTHQKQITPKLVVHCVRRYLPSRGGVETHLAALVTLHQAQGDKVVVITEQADQNGQTSEQIKNLQVIRLPGPFTKLKVWQHIWRLREVFRAATVVHAHDVGWWLLPVLPFIAGRFFITFHGWEGQWPVRWQAKLHRRLLSLFAVRTMHVGAWIQQWYWDVPSLVTYGGVWPAQLETDPSSVRLVQAVARCQLKLVFVGRLEAENEVEGYVKCINLLRKKGWNIKITWVGDGSLRSKAASVGTVTGMIAPEKVIEYFQQAGLVFTNSYLSIWQALAAGKLVAALATNPLKQSYLESFPAANSLLIANGARELVVALEQLQDYSVQELNARIFDQLQQVADHTWPKVFSMYQRLWWGDDRRTQHG